MKVFVVLLALISLAYGVDVEDDRKKNSSGMQARIANGITASEGQFTYEVGLYVIPNSIRFCGGSLIGQNWIITSASCADGAQSIYAFLGSVKMYAGKVVPVHQIVVHNGFNRNTLQNNIALLRIPSVSVSGSKVSTVKLPPLTNANSYLDEDVIAVGWGNTDDSGSRGRPNIMQYAQSKVAQNELCAHSFAGNHVFTDSNICVLGYMGTSSCKGDSGHSLVHASSGVLVGINSYGAVRCSLGYPEGYTRVSSYRSWIKGITGI